MKKNWSHKLTEAIVPYITMALAWNMAGGRIANLFI
jgi:hypothetical protein